MQTSIENVLDIEQRAMGVFYEFRWNLSAQCVPVPKRGNPRGRLSCATRSADVPRVFAYVYIRSPYSTFNFLVNKNEQAADIVRLNHKK